MTRARNPHWDGLAAVFGYSPTSQQERKLWGKLCVTFAEMNATEAGIIEAATRYRDAMPGAALTPTALVKHYERLMATSVATPGNLSVGGKLIQRALELREVQSGRGNGNAGSGNRGSSVPRPQVAGRDDRALGPGAADGGADDGDR